MTYSFTTLSDLKAAGFDDVIDVRAPLEYAEDHIPGAINLPVLSDAERAEVGTIYVQEDRFRARKVGAAHVSRNAAHHLETVLRDKPGGWRPLVYCWRGGQRSGSFASILAQIGWRVELLDGGYRSYRKEVVKTLYETPMDLQILLIDGMTGTAKTRILHRLAALGHQIIDLEGLACHRGSLFGATGQDQPAQKSFESQLIEHLAGFDPGRPVLIEAESNKVGEILIPPSLWAAMQRAKRVEITASLGERARFLERDYGDLTRDPDRLSKLIGALTSFHGHEKVAHWQDLARTQGFADLAAELMQDHYDPRYQRSRARNLPDTVLHQAIEDLSEEGLEVAAKALSSKIRSYSKTTAGVPA